MEQWTIEPGSSKLIDLELVRKLKLTLIRGQVDVIGHDEPGARVEVHSVSGRSLKVTIDGDRLDVDHPQLRWDNFIDVFRSFSGSARADVSIMVPRDVALKFGVVSSNALVSGLGGNGKLSTVSGDLVIDGLVGDLDINSVSGEVSIQDHAGRITAHTVSGDITASGSIDRFSADSVSADLFLDLDGSPDDISTNTVSGDTTIRLDAEIGARYTVNTASGRLQLDDMNIVGVHGKGYNSTTASVDGSWVDVRCNSVSGNISVVRRTRRSTPDEQTGVPA